MSWETSNRLPPQPFAPYITASALLTNDSRSLAFGGKHGVVTSTLSRCNRSARECTDHRPSAVPLRQRELRQPSIPQQSRRVRRGQGAQLMAT